MNLKKLVVSVLAAAMALGLSAQNVEIDWNKSVMDGSRTGCIAPNKENVKEALGYIKGGKYHAPSGKIYGRKTATYKSAQAVLDAQPNMSRTRPSSCRMILRNYRSWMPVIWTTASIELKR